ncbi:DUF1302 family protein [Thauera sp. JM12B12]|uniref:DUF1302 domain-containing protein n=1 Tax=Thauera sp. JM12B12 TaxID=3142262 RepID=UPI0031F34C36
MKLHKKMKPVALAVIGMGVMSPAFAGKAIEFDNGMVLDWRVNSTYTMSTRLESRDALLSSEATNANGNDGNNNFDRGALTANRLSLLLDAKLTKGNSGLVMSASTFYDDVYHRSNDNSLSTSPNKLSGAPDEFNSATKRYHGGYSRLLDLYGYTSVDIGEEGRATFRLGKHVVSWGEALFFPGISLAQGPADGTKTGVPGTEVKDQLLPEDQLSVQYEVNDKLSLLGHVQYNWHETIAPAVGSFLSTSDVTGPGAECLKVSGFCAVQRTADDRPGKTGQWGVGTRYRVTDETEVGLYYLNYHDRTPNVDTNFISGPSYSIRYQEDVKLLGATLSTTFGVATLGMEVSYKKDAPALVKTALVNRGVASVIPTATTADILQTNVNTFINLGRTWLAPQSQLLAEISYVDVRNPAARRVPGASSLPAAFVDFVAPENSDLFFGSHGMAFQALLSSTYPGIVENWELGTTVAYARQLQGRTLLGGVGGEGDHRLSVGATMTYKRNFQVGLTYLGYFGDANLGRLGIEGPKNFRGLTDRDQLSLTMKYSF